MKKLQVFTSVAAVALVVFAGLGAYGTGRQAETGEKMATGISLAHSLYDLKAAAEFGTDSKESQAVMDFTDNMLQLLPESARQLGLSDTAYDENYQIDELPTVEEELKKVTGQAFESFAAADEEPDRALALKIAQQLWKFDHTTFNEENRQTLPDFIADKTLETAPCADMDERAAAPRVVNSLVSSLHAYLYAAQVYKARTNVDSYNTSTAYAVSNGLAQAENWHSEVIDSVACTFQVAQAAPSYSIHVADPQVSLNQLRANVINNVNVALADPELATDTKLFSTLVKLAFTADYITER